MAGTRRTKKQETFEFTYDGKKYAVGRPYKGQPATFVLSDGYILEVQMWQFIPTTEPVEPSVERFDPKLQPPAELAAAKSGFLAELQP